MLSKLIESFNEEKSKFQSKIKEAFKEEIKKLVFPDRIKSIGWTQYTPYFNDGDSCEFSVNCDYLYVNDEREDDDEDNFLSKYIYEVVNGKYERVPNPNYDKECGEFVDKFSTLIGQIPNEVMLDMFGDHVIVTYSGGNFKVSEYSHD